MEKRKSRKKLIRVSVILAVSIGLLLFYLVSAAWAADCPFGGSAERMGTVGRSYCGGTGYDSDVMNRHDKSSGSGMNVKESSGLFKKKGNNGSFTVFLKNMMAAIDSDHIPSIFFKSFSRSLSFMFRLLTKTA